jgi:hypothetical protein
MAPLRAMAASRTEGLSRARHGGGGAARLG